MLLFDLSLHAKLVKPILHDQVSFRGIFKNMWTYFNTLDLLSFFFFQLLIFFLFFPVGRSLPFLSRLQSSLSGPARVQPIGDSLFPLSFSLSRCTGDPP